MMGWMFVHKPKGEKVEDFFQGEFGWKTPAADGSVGRVLACSANLHEAYIAFEQTWPDGRREVRGIVCLLQYRPHDYYSFGYKDIDEEMGPASANCPERILKLLTPTDNELAQKWRERCWENLRARKARPRLKKDMVIRFSEPIEFRSGRQQEFRVVDPRRLVFSDPQRSWNYYKIHRWTLQNCKWSVVA